MSNASKKLEVPKYNRNHLRSWKKVYENDLKYIITELKDSISKPACILLSGIMGAGKTSFTKVFAENSSEGEILSPTYSVVSETRNITHADFYRLEDPEEIVHLELPLYLEKKDYFIVEWGRHHVRNLKKTVENFAFYEVDILVNQAKQSGKEPSRNYELFELE